MRKMATGFTALLFVLTLFAGTTVFVPGQAEAQYAPELGDGFRLAWTLDPRDYPELFPRGPAFGARSILVGMDFDRDGKREILFTTDETLAPGGPDPGYLEVFLYENDGNDNYTHVWHYTHTDASNSLPPLTYGDIDNDGNPEIYFGVPTIGNDPVDVFIFEADENGVFPTEPTLTLIITEDGAADFRPSGFVIDDIDDDGKKELAIQSRKGGNRELVILSLATDVLDEFASFNEEFRAGEDILGGGGAYDIEVVDFDGDGKKEIWYNTWDNFTFTVFEADSADSYSLQVELDGIFPERDPGSFNSHDMYFHDIDGDDKMEAWFPMTNGVLYYLEDIDDVSALTADSFTRVGQFAELGRSRGSSVGDIDDDGKWDIVATHGRNEKVSRIEYTGVGSPADSVNYEWTIILNSEGEPTDRYYPPRIAPVDMDGDGLKEVFLTNLYGSEAGQPIIIALEYDPSTASTLANGWTMTSTTTHTEVDSFYATDVSGNSRTAIGGFDLDQDGKKEIILTDYARAGVQVMEYNAESNVFETVWMSPIDTVNNRRLGSNPRTVLVGDLDSDEKMEIVFPLATEPSGWYVFEWDGVVGSDNYGDTFSSIISTEIDTCCAADYTRFRADHEGAAILDVDGDGVTEFIVGIRRNASGGKRGTLISYVEGDIEHNAGGNGLETWNTEFFVDRGDYGGGSPYPPLPADLDGDGTFEIVNPTWNNFNFYNIDVTGADSYATADVNSATKNFQADPDQIDDFAIFGGGAGDIDGDGDDEAFFPSFKGGDLWVIDYKSGDDVLSIDANHVVRVVDNVGGSWSTFYASVFDVDKNGRANVFVGSTYPRMVSSVELVGSDPRNPADYQTQVVYTGEADIRRDIVVTDSAGVVTTTWRNVSGFASKVQSHWDGNAIDFDDDGKNEVLVSFQGVQDSITTTTYRWDEATATWDTTVTKVPNPKAWAVILLEFDPQGSSVSSQELTFVTPDDYILEQNYPNPFNPTTNIRYTLPLQKRVSLKIYNIMGQVVKTLVNDQVQAKGTYEITWDGTNDAGIRVSSGTYIYSLEFGNFKKSKRMMLVK